MCFGGSKYKVKNKAAWGDTVREEASGAPAHGFGHHGASCWYYPAQHSLRTAGLRPAVVPPHTGHLIYGRGVVPNGYAHGHFGLGRAGRPNRTAVVS